MEGVSTVRTTKAIALLVCFVAAAAVISWRSTECESSPSAPVVGRLAVRGLQLVIHDPSHGNCYTVLDRWGVPVAQNIPYLELRLRFPRLAALSGGRAGGTAPDLWALQ